MKILFGLLATFSFLTWGHAQTTGDSVRIKGFHKDYAGYHLVFKTTENLYLQTPRDLASMYVDESGHFDFTLPLNKITYAYTDLGRTRAFIYLEPETTYQLQLPPFIQRRESERLNPFFRPDETIMGIINKDARALNRQMVEFSYDFDYLFNKNAMRLALKGGDQIAKTIEDSLTKKYTFKHPLFEQHKQLSFLKLRLSAHPRQERQLINKYLKNQSVNYELPKYREAFTLLFKNFLPDGLADDIKDSVRKELSYRQRFDSLTNIVITDTIFGNNKELADLMLLYGLYQGLDENRIDENTVLFLTKSAIQYGSTEKVRQLASQQYQQLTKLRPGTEAPDFVLYNENGKKRSLADYKGKFIYLNFMHTQNYACRRDLETLAQLEKIFRKDLEIVTVLVDNDIDDAQNYLDGKNYKWDFLNFAAQPKILDDYNIMATPAYYLISPEGNLSLSPAPSPEENFRNKFVEKQLQNKQQKMRNQKEDNGRVHFFLR
ncbi:TlpA family protein disulfide reductase [Geofilum sp. OHC36d9]|uniref:TlpA family protein disulfide reductase n=1 Tax=Geofilum sp. OHC36d9 TaxID=3458413 RepID=UPI004033B025